MVNDCRIGASIAETHPKANERMYTQARVAIPATSSTPRIRAHNAMVVWVAMRSLRLSNRSASAPAGSDTMAVGPNCKAMTMPTATPLPPDSSSTSQSWAMRCIQVPTSETTCPPAQRR